MLMLACVAPGPRLTMQIRGVPLSFHCASAIFAAAPRVANNQSNVVLRREARQAPKESLPKDRVHTLNAQSIYEQWAPVRVG